MPKAAANLPDLPSYLPGESDKAFKTFPPRQVKEVTNTAKDLYNIDQGSALKDRVAERIVIHNLSTVPLKWCLDDTCEAGKFHDITGAGSAVESGDGGAYVFFPRRDSISRISAFSVGGDMNVSVVLTHPVDKLAAI